MTKTRRTKKPRTQKPSSSSVVREDNPLRDQSVRQKRGLHENELSSESSHEGERETPPLSKKRKKHDRTSSFSSSEGSSNSQQQNSNNLFGSTSPSRSSQSEAVNASRSSSFEKYLQVIEKREFFY